MSKVFTDQVNKTKMLITGMKNKSGLVKHRGLDDAFINQLETDTNLAASYNEELERLKSQVREKTRQANAKLIEVKNQVKAAKKVIKSDFDQTKWHEFGIADKR